MRLQLLRNSAQKPHALVLGPSCVAEPIARSLGVQGYEAHTHPGALPLLSDATALEKLSRILEEFRRSLPQETQADRRPLVHPGSSPWAERPELSQLAESQGLQLVAPPVRVMSLYSNRLTLLAEAQKAGVPNLLLQEDPIQGVREAQELFERIGRKAPLVLKPVRGGANPSVLTVHGPEDLERKLPLWIDQLRVQIGETTLLAERTVEGARQITVPFTRFQDGRFRTFPLIDSSLQSQGRKIIEFCPPENLDPSMESRLTEWSRQIAEHTRYVGVGSFDFLVDGSRAFLIGALCRLGAGYSAWERMAGTQAVAWQIAAEEGASGEPTVLPSPEWKSTLCLRIQAEDPLLQLPQPGTIRELSQVREWKFPGAAAELSLPLEPGRDLDAGDSALLGVLTVGARERKHAITLARGVLEETWIAGTLQTNERFLSELLLHPWVREGMFHAGFLDEEFVPELRPEQDLLKALVSVCALTGSEPKTRWAAADQWVKPDPDSLSWSVGPLRWKKDHDLEGVSGELMLPDGRKARVCADPVLRDRWQVRIGSWALPVRRVHPPGSPLREMLPAGVHRLTALVPGRVRALLFQEGARVPAHEPLLILEALHTLVPHALPADARIVKWIVKPEQRVQAGEALAWFRLD